MHYYNSCAHDHRCCIEMYFDDHNPPHFHVITRKDERIAVVIETLVIQARSADSRDTEQAFEWASEHRAKLRALWKEYSEVQPPKDRKR
jgi:Domain of unknown function (DUF4160)